MSASCFERRRSISSFKCQGIIPTIDGQTIAGSRAPDEPKDHPASARRRQNVLAGQVNNGGSMRIKPASLTDTNLKDEPSLRINAKSQAVTGEPFRAGRRIFGEVPLASDPDKTKVLTPRNGVWGGAAYRLLRLQELRDARSDEPHNKEEKSEKGGARRMPRPLLFRSTPQLSGSSRRADRSSRRRGSRRRSDRRRRRRDPSSAAGRPSRRGRCASRPECEASRQA